MNCALHKTLPLQFFCQTCFDPICSECIQSNPHSNQYHRISTLQQAINTRKLQFYLFVENEINPLRQKIRQKLLQIKQTQQQQLLTKNLIFKDILLQFQGIDHRTKDKSEKKILQYQTEIKHYQGYLNCLDDVVYTFDKSSQDPYNFLIMYQDMNVQLKSLQSKTITQQIDQFVVNESSAQYPQYKQIDKGNHFQKLFIQLNIPRQIKSTYSKLSTLEQMRQRIQFLNALIGEACENYQNEKKRIQSEVQKKYQQRLHTFNRMNQSILELNPCKACAFCGLTFTLQTLNDQCLQNKSLKVQIAKSYSHIDVPVQFKGTKQHYWVDSSLQDRKVPDPNSHPLIKIKQKKQFLNSLKDLQVIKCCFRKYEIDKLKVDTQTKTVEVKDFIEVFENADKDQRGMLSKITFKYILTKTFEMDETHCDVLVVLLSQNWKVAQKVQEGELSGVKSSQVSQKSNQKFPDKIEAIEGVNYKLLQQFVNNPQFIYEQWLKIEEQIQKSKPIGPASKQTSKYKPRY